MQKRLIAGAAATAGLATALVLGPAVAASAHVEATTTDTAANAYTTMTFSVPHGCDGSPTTALTFHMPTAIIEVTPTVNPNWTISTTTEPYTSATSSTDGETAADAGKRVTSVTYTATTPLPADERDTFDLSFSLPDGKAGDVVAFPVTQTCEQGSTEWDQIQKPGQEEPEHPAPSVTLTAASSESDDDAAAAADTATPATATAAGDAQPDLVARGLGIAGLVVGAVGVVAAVIASKRRTR